MQNTVIAFGELLWDLLPDRTVLGGAPFNFAFRINELGDRGIPVSRLGSDPHGTRATAQVASLGVDTSFLQEDDRHPTGTVLVRFETPSKPDYFIVPEE